MTESACNYDRVLETSLTLSVTLLVARQSRKNSLPRSRCSRSSDRTWLPSGSAPNSMSASTPSIACRSRASAFSAWKAGQGGAPQLLPLLRQGVSSASCKQLSP